MFALALFSSVVSAAALAEARNTDTNVVRAALQPCHGCADWRKKPTVVEPVPEPEVDEEYNDVSDNADPTCPGCADSKREVVVEKVGAPFYSCVSLD